mmetsp:Transcript_2821/g.2456  ORF Transcript_2821/g.2456 Transcript_2821/m.2456 type:complete len:109 (-) Transcript_2821:31-357(-)
MTCMTSTGYTCLDSQRLPGTRSCHTHTDAGTHNNTYAQATGHSLSSAVGRGCKWHDSRLALPRPNMPVAALERISMQHADILLSRIVAFCTSDPRFLSARPTTLHNLA